MILAIKNDGKSLDFYMSTEMVMANNATAVEKGNIAYSIIIDGVCRVGQCGPSDLPDTASIIGDGSNMGALPDGKGGWHDKNETTVDVLDFLENYIGYAAYNASLVALTGLKSKFSDGIAETSDIYHLGVLLGATNMIALANVIHLKSEKILMLLDVFVDIEHIPFTIADKQRVLSGNTLAKKDLN